MSKPEQGMHDFERDPDDPNGPLCRCGMPKRNRRHPQNARDGVPKPGGTQLVIEPPLPPLDAGIPPARMDHPQTSIDAALGAAPTAGKAKDRILRAIAGRRWHGMTDAELERALG